MTLVWLHQGWCYSSISLSLAPTFVDSKGKLGSEDGHACAYTKSRSAHMLTWLSCKPQRHHTLWETFLVSDNVKYLGIWGGGDSWVVGLAWSTGALRLESRMPSDPGLQISFPSQVILFKEQSQAHREFKGPPQRTWQGYFHAFP